MLCKPFEDAHQEFMRRNPPGTKPTIILVGSDALSVFRRCSPDEIYDLDGSACRLVLLPSKADRWTIRVR
jgi:hypothetical protein